MGTGGELRVNLYPRPDRVQQGRRRPGALLGGSPCGENDPVARRIRRSHQIALASTREAGLPQAILLGREQLGAGQHDLELTQPAAAGRRGRRVLARPGVEAEVMVVSARGDEQGARVAADGDIEAERARVEGLGGGKVADVEVYVAHPGSRRHAGVGVLAAQLSEHSVEVERQRVHLEDSGAEGPLVAGAVAVELDAVALRVAQVERLADEMIV